MLRLLGPAYKEARWTPDPDPQKRYLPLTDTAMDSYDLYMLWEKQIITFSFIVQNVIHAK
jgi:hypothetical protein